MGTVSETLVYGLPCFWILPLKGKTFWDSGWRGTHKKSILKSRTEKYLVVPKTCFRRVYGFGTVEWVGTTVSLTTLRSWMT